MRKWRIFDDPTAKSCDDLRRLSPSLPFFAKHHRGDLYKSEKVDGDVYLKAMRLYKKELEAWQARENDHNFQKLHILDPAWKHFGGCLETPLPRIIDKCTFVGDKWK